MQKYFVIEFTIKEYEVDGFGCGEKIEQETHFFLGDESMYKRFLKALKNVKTP